MKYFLKKLKLKVFFTAILFAALENSYASTITVRGFVPYRQLGSNWCWAAASQMLLLQQHQSSATQCRIVSRVFGRSCCASNGGPASGCDTGDDLARTLQVYGQRTFDLDPIYSDVLKTIQNNRPVAVMMWHKSSSGTNHFIVIYGINHVENESKASFLIYDPFYGNREVNAHKMLHDGLDNRFWSSATAIR